MNPVPGRPSLPRAKRPTGDRHAIPEGEAEANLGDYVEETSRRMLTLGEAKTLVCPVVYGLCDADGDVFYVGQTRNAARRFQSHRENRSGNRRLKSKLASLGRSVRVLVLHQSPASLNDVEREEIRARGRVLVNLIGADSSVWSKHSAVPWAAGTGVLAPSAYAVSRANPDLKRLARQKLAAMSPAERCMAEIDLYREFPPLLRRRFDKWLDMTAAKMLACLEAIYDAPRVC